MSSSIPISNLSDSQNFIKNRSTVTKLLQMCNLPKEITVLEIGPGKGIITQQLCEIVNKVIAVEYDIKLANSLREKLKDYSNLEIVNMDFLKYPLPTEKYIVVSNIPFNITADIINRLMEASNTPEVIYFIMQKETFYKHAGSPYCLECLKSIIIKPFYEAYKILDMRGEDFYPVPHVDIVFASFIKRQYCDIKIGTPENYKDFIAYLFMAKGHTYKEKLKDLFSYEQIKRMRKQVKLEYDDKITTWGYESFLKLYKEFINRVCDDKKQKIIGSYQKYKIQQSTIDKIHRSRNTVS